MEIQCCIYLIISYLSSPRSVPLWNERWYVFSHAGFHYLINRLMLSLVMGQVDVVNARLKQWVSRFYSALFTLLLWFDIKKKFDVF